MLSEAKINEIRKLFSDSLKKVTSKGDLENIRIEYIGRKQGKITDLFSEIPKLSHDQKKKLVPLLTELKNSVVKQIEGFNFETPNRARPKKQEFISQDLSIPGKKPNYGHEHPTL